MNDFAMKVSKGVKEVIILEAGKMSEKIPVFYAVSNILSTRKIVT